MIDIVSIAAKNSGGIVKLSRKLGIKHTSLYSWKRVPAERVLDMERLSGISRREIRPDLYGTSKRKTPPESLSLSDEVPA